MLQSSLDFQAVATAAAISITPTWQDRAVGYVRLYAVVHDVMLCEHVRVFAELDGFVPPPDKRAWGDVMRRAARERLIRADGYAPAASSNNSPKVKWRSLVREC